MRVNIPRYEHTFSFAVLADIYGIVYLANYLPCIIAVEIL
jgi:hypothetical protein